VIRRCISSENKIERDNSFIVTNFIRSLLLILLTRVKYGPCGGMTFRSAVQVEQKYEWRFKGRTESN